MEDDQVKVAVSMVPLAVAGWTRSMSVRIVAMGTSPALGAATALPMLRDWAPAAPASHTEAARASSEGIRCRRIFTSKVRVRFTRPSSPMQDCYQSAVQAVRLQADRGSDFRDPGRPARRGELIYRRRGSAPRDGTGRGAIRIRVWRG